MSKPANRSSITAATNLRLAVGALGVVFGDIGTSPLYAFRESFIGAHPLPIDRPHVMGVLSLIVWALTLVVTVKYVFITMRADNRGEGGSFALLSLIRRVAPSAHLLPAITTAALLATALFYGDAIITPAISILSAVEGLTLVHDEFARRSHSGDARHHRSAFLPYSVSVPSCRPLLRSPHVGLVCGHRRARGAERCRTTESAFGRQSGYAFDFVGKDPLRAFLTLGTVVLTITGAEALYADMGHFGRRPIAAPGSPPSCPRFCSAMPARPRWSLGDPGADRAGLLSAGADLGAVAVAGTGDGRDRDRQPIGHQRRLFGDAAGHAVGLSASAAPGAYLRRRDGPGVRPGGQRHPVPHRDRSRAGLPVIDRVRLRLRLRRDLDHGADDPDHGLRHLPHMAAASGVDDRALYAVLLAFDLALFGASATKIPDGAWLPLAIATL